MSGRNGTRIVIVVLALGITIAGCARGASPATARHAAYRYSCCLAGDIAPVRQAGEAVTVHWIATAAPPPAVADTAAPVTLAAALTGPFSDAAALKAAMAISPRPTPAIVAATLRTTDQAGGTPVSTLMLPAATLPGLYDITTTVTSGGGTETGDAVLQVGADPNTG